MAKSLSQEQFGAHAQGYLTSKPHAQGKSLDRMVALARPHPDWRGIDVATGAGHTAYAFAPHVARMWATDITDDQTYLNLVATELNNRPRRILGYRTPAEVFTDLLASEIASTS